MPLFVRNLARLPLSRLATCLGMLLLPASSHAQSDLAFARAAHLRHGINTSNWFAQHPSDYSVARLRSFTTADDLALIHKLGFDHIRLSIDADPLVAWQSHASTGTAFVGELDRVIAEANAQKLAVIVDIHPESHYKQNLLQGSDGVQRFAALWQALAAHLSSTDPDLVFFEIMNEPEQSDPYRWEGIENTVVERIRVAAPRHTIIAAGARWSGLEDLLTLQPLNQPNIIYTFHDYEPFPFTHQGATWTDPRVIPLRDVPYPSTPENVLKSEDQEPTLSGKFFVDQYGLDRWNAQRVDRTVSFAETWGAKHHVPVYCGEFGVHKPFADPQARAAWVQDMRSALEAHHIGWAMWDYQDNFGIVTKGNGHTAADPLLVQALGLNAVQ